MIAKREAPRLSVAQRAAPRLSRPTCWLLGAVLAGCYSPDLLSGGFLCEPMTRTCPEGFTCANGRCYVIGQEAAASACTMGGVVAAPGVYACRGKFAPGMAQGLCQQGYSVCTALPAGLSPTSCDDFYAINTPASTAPGGALVCTAPPMGQQAVLVGCGGTSGVQTYGALCGGTGVGILCQGGPGDWTCTRTLGDASHFDSQGGVLCCPNKPMTTKQ